MSMKIFTLSAVCVLVYGLMIALSGTTSFQGYTDESDFVRSEDRREVVSAAYRSAEPAAVNSPTIQNWNRSVGEYGLTDGQSPNGIQAGSRLIRLFGVVFILVWIWVSVKLLSLD